MSTPPTPILGSQSSKPENKNNRQVSQPVPIGIGATLSIITPANSFEDDLCGIPLPSPFKNQTANLIPIYLGLEDYELALDLYNQLKGLEKETAKDKVDQYFKNQEYKKIDMTEWREKFNIPKTT